MHSTYFRVRHTVTGDGTIANPVLRTVEPRDVWPSRRPDLSGRLSSAVRGSSGGFQAALRRAANSSASITPAKATSGANPAFFKSCAASA